MILGQKGVKYGLQIRKPEDSDKDKSSKPAPPAKNNSVFGDEESDDEHDDVERQIARHAERKKTDKKASYYLCISFGFERFEYHFLCPFFMPL